MSMLMPSWWAGSAKCSAVARWATGAMAIDGTDIETRAHAPSGTADEDRRGR